MSDPKHYFMNRQKTYKLAFAFEEMMGHVTHAQNLKRVLATRPDVAPFWALLPFEPLSGWLGKVPVLKGSWAAQASITAYRKLKSRLRRSDAVLFHTQMCSLSTLFIARRVPCLISMDCALYDGDAFYGSRNTSRAETLKIRFFRALFGRTRAMVAFSPWVADSLAERYGVPRAKIHIIPPGIDTETFRPEPQARRHDGVVQLLFVGNGFDRKGGDLLLRWAREHASDEARAKAGLPPWELHIVSRDPIEPTPGVIVHDNVSNNSPELIQMYQSSDIFVLPSYSDCHPFVLLEAMACGLPSVTTRTGGIPYMIGEGKAGRLVPVGDYDALSASVNEVVSNAPLRQELGAAARARAEELYDATCNYNRLLDLMIACRRGRPAPVAENPAS